MNAATSTRRELLLRPFLAVAGLALGALAWFAEVNSHPGPLSRPQVLIALVPSLIGTLALGIARTSERTLGPARLALVLATLLSLLMILSMPIPPHRETVGSDIVLGIVIVLAISAYLLLDPQPRIALIILTGMAAIGLLLDYAVAVYLTRPGITASVKESASWVAFTGNACIAAAWLARHAARRALVPAERLAL